MRYETSRLGNSPSIAISTFPSSDAANPFDDVETDLDGFTWLFDPVGSRGGRDESGFQWKINFLLLKGETANTALDGYGIGGGGEVRFGAFSFGKRDLKLLIGADLGIMDLFITRKTDSGTGTFQSDGPFFRSGSPKAFGSAYLALGLAGEDFEVFVFRRDLRFLSGKDYLTDLTPKFTGVLISIRFD